MTRGKIYGSTLTIKEYVDNYYITSQRLLVNVRSLEESLMFNKPHIHFEITGDPFNLIGSQFGAIYSRIAPFYALNSTFSQLMRQLY